MRFEFKLSTRAFFALLFAALLASRLCHLGILWTEEGLPLAAAVQMLHGKFLYRDVWFDKPPLVPAIYLLWGADTAWAGRIAGALFCLLSSALIYRFARDRWSEREGRAAAALLAFFLTFGIPAAVMALAADLLMVAPHIAAVYFAWRRRPFLSGVMGGLALLANSKAAFVLAACALWQPRALPWLIAGAAVPQAAVILLFAAQGALRDYYEQVWQLGGLYARSTFIEHPFREGLLRTVNWAGFHLALVAGAAWYWVRERDSDRWRMLGWAALSLAAVAAGWRFFPRYYFQILPVFVLAAARGYTLLGRRRWIMLLLLLVPLVRFGPRYASLAGDLAAGRPHEWRDTGIDRDSRIAANQILRLARPGDTLFVWGYRPDLYAYTRLPAATRYLESQPLSGVFADRHLFQQAAVAPESARARRVQIVQSHPEFIADGLGALNPALAIDTYPELRDWLAEYRLVTRTGATIIYKRQSGRR